MRISLLLSIIGHPRCHVRAEGLSAAGADCRLLGFERPSMVPGALSRGVESLGFVRDGHYPERLPMLRRAARRVREVARESDVLYCFGPDMLMLARWAVRGLPDPPALAYEVGDIRESFVGDGPSAWAARFLERRAMSGISLIAVTSDAYLRGYYYPLQGLQALPSVLVEPKVDPERLPAVASRAGEPWDGVLRIAYYGWMCCAQSWKTLRRLAEEGGERVQIRLRGHLWGDLADKGPEIDALGNVEYGGPFENPEQLHEIFEGVDLAWVAHYDLLPNVLWARASRFFSAGYFQVPMLAQRRTEDGAVVEGLGIGRGIDLRDPESAARDVLAITAADIEQWRANLARVPLRTFAFTDEHEQMLATFASLGRGHGVTPRVRRKMHAGD